jgi:multiple sugar transport system permease protein
MSEFEKETLDSQNEAVAEPQSEAAKAPLNEEVAEPQIEVAEEAMAEEAVVDTEAPSVEELENVLQNEASEASSEAATEAVAEPTVKEKSKKIKTMHEKDMKKVVSAQKVMKIIAQIFLYLFLGVMALIVIFPFYWMIISSLKTLTEYQEPIPTLFPRQIEWRNYVEAVKAAELIKLFKNTVIVGIVSTLLSLVITVISAFVFARLEFKGRDTLFAVLLGTMMIPGELFTITNYITVSNWGWVSTSNSLEAIKGYGVLIVPFLVSIFYVYLLKQNFMQIPNELYLAAKVDGTSDLKYLWKVMIPLALPTLISITILKMMGAWNSYVWPRLVSPTNYHLITNGLRKAFEDTTTGTANIPQQMAAVTLVSIPLFLVFIFLRKYIMKGVSRSGIKG